MEWPLCCEGLKLRVKWSCQEREREIRKQRVSTVTAPGILSFEQDGMNGRILWGLSHALRLRGQKLSTVWTMCSGTCWWLCCTAPPPTWWSHREDVAP